MLGGVLFTHLAFTFVPNDKRKRLFWVPRVPCSSPTSSQTKSHHNRISISRTSVHTIYASLKFVHILRIQNKISGYIDPARPASDPDHKYTQFFPPDFLGVPFIMMTQRYSAFGLTFISFLLGVATASAQYSLVDTYDASNFFGEFDFFSGSDPTHGFVQYVDNVTANLDGLAGYVDRSVYLGVDHTTAVAAGSAGRSSVRVSSKKAYTQGLFVADISHMPAGSNNSCGLWPAFWMFGPSWPNSGEIDIIEGVNSQSSNIVTLHTSAGCSMAHGTSFSTNQLNVADCEGTTGCGQPTESSNNYGKGFNAGGGGVYAVEWTSQSISVWFFPRGSSGIAALTGSGAAAPDPSSFGTPQATFVGNSGCNIDEHFVNHSLVFDTTFCGDWAGQVWAQDATCSALAATCNDYVSQNAADFKEAYWLVNSVQVYQQGTGAATRRGRQVQQFTA